MIDNTITILKLRIKSLFCDWRKIPLIEQDVLEPGIYLIKSKCWGLKGLIASHQWFYIVDEFKKELCLEITDYETVIFQKATWFKHWGNIASPQQKTIILSNRKGTSFWFGNKPKVICKLDISLNELLDICDSKPLKEYHLFLNNCNHFVDYVKKAIQQKQPL